MQDLKSHRRLRSKHNVFVAIALLFALFAVRPTLGQRLMPAASDGQHLWIVDEQGEDDFALMHRWQAGRGVRLSLVRKLRGRVDPDAITAADGAVWLAFDDGSVLTVRAIAKPADLGWQYIAVDRPSLPAEASLRSLAASDEGVWALARIESRQAYQQLLQHQPRERSQTQEDDPLVLDLLLGLPPGSAEKIAARQVEEKQATDDSDEPTDDAKEDAAEDESPALQPPLDAQSNDADATGDEEGGNDSAAAEENAAAQLESEHEAAPSDTTDTAQPDIPGTFPADCLLRLDGPRWVLARMPDDWQTRSFARMVFLHPSARVPALVTQTSRDMFPRGLTLYRHRDGQWRSTQLRYDGVIPPRLIALDRQLVTASVTEYGSPAVQLVLPRPDNLRTTRLGTPIPLVRGADSRWALAPYGGTISVIMKMPPAAEVVSEAEPPTTLHIHRRTLRGDQLPTFKMVEYQPGFLERTSPWIIQAGALAIATLLMVAFWPRTEEELKLYLPLHLEFADYGRRLFAGILDLIPPFAFVMLFTGRSPEFLLFRWPGWVEGNIWTIRESLFLIMIVIMYTMLFEIVTGRTPGKMLLKIHVIALTGDRQYKEQALVRNVARMFDLIQPLLLLLPIIWPTRQRMGDLLARTMVVQEIPPERLKEVEREHREKQKDDDDDIL